MQLDQGILHVLRVTWLRPCLPDICNDASEGSAHELRIQKLQHLRRDLQEIEIGDKDILHSWFEHLDDNLLLTRL